MSARTLAALAARLGPGGLVEEPEAGVWTVAGREPVAVAFPRSAAEVASVLEHARNAGWGVVPTGAGHELCEGREPARPVVVLSTRRMQEVTVYEPADLTMTAGAGLTLGDLEARVAGEGQWLPLDPPSATTRSLGGAVARGSAGPLSPMFGAPRDLVLGLTVVIGDGRVLRVGGRVVKNVAGYDLVRLIVGSRGTLGVITSVSLRLFPRPAVDRVLVSRAGDASDLVRPGRAVATARVLPASAQIVRSEISDGSALVVRVVGAPKQVDADCAVLTGATDGALQPVDEAEARVLLDAARDAGSTGDVRIEVSVRPADVAWALDLVRELREEPASASTAGGGFACCVLSGAVRAGWRVEAPGDEAREVELSGALSDARRRLEERGGTLTLVRAPGSVLREVGVYGLGRGVAPLMRELKKTFDPEAVLCPGRLGV